VVIYICKLKDSVIKLVLKNTYQYYYHLQLENKVLDNNAAYQEVLEDTKDVIRIPSKMMRASKCNQHYSKMLTLTYGLVEQELPTLPTTLLTKKC
jgi:hypothetical protein